ncbi:unnamed protein product, partial [Symbiodinium sp. CCMP2592]
MACLVEQSPWGRVLAHDIAKQMRSKFMDGDIRNPSNYFLTNINTKAKHAMHPRSDDEEFQAYKTAKSRRVERQARGAGEGPRDGWEPVKSPSQLNQHDLPGGLGWERVMDSLDDDQNLVIEGRLRRQRTEELKREGIDTPEHGAGHPSVDRPKGSFVPRQPVLVPTPAATHARGEHGGRTPHGPPRPSTASWPTRRTCPVDHIQQCSSFVWADHKANFKDDNATWSRALDARRREDIKPAVPQAPAKAPAVPSKKTTKAEPPSEDDRMSVQSAGQKSTTSKMGVHSQFSDATLDTSLPGSATATTKDKDKAKLLRAMQIAKEEMEAKKLEVQFLKLQSQLEDPEDEDEDVNVEEHPVDDDDD